MVEIVKFPVKPNFNSKKSGAPYATYENFAEMLRIRGIEISFNEIRKELDVTIPGENFLPDNYLNCCIAMLCSISEEFGMGTKYMLKYMLREGDKNKKNPVIDWIESTPWDSKVRLQDFYDTIKSTNEPLKEILMQRWMVSAVAALYEPEGISAGGMLVLLGRQYLGKTNWFKNLVPDEMRKYIADGMNVDPHDRDSFMPCLENWIVELGEIDATFRKADLAALKAFINRQLDTTRLAYAANNSRFPRRTVFFGSVDKRSYLTDPAGNRRFWTIDCLSINHTHGLDMQQVWAEIACMYHDGEPWLLVQDEFKMLSESNEDFEAIDPMKEKIMRAYRWGDETSLWLTATEILEDLGYKNIGRSEATACALLVRKLNGDQHRRSHGRSTLGLPWKV